MKIRTLSSEEEAAFFDRYAGIVYGVCKKLNFSFFHTDFEDFVQLGLLKLVDAYEMYPYSLEEENSITFASFAYQHVYWHFLDILRKEQKRTKHECTLSEENKQLKTESVGQIHSFIETDLFKKLLSCLTPTEQELLLDLVFYELTVTAAAKKHQVSRKTIYKRCKHIRSKLLPYYEEIKDKTIGGNQNVLSY